VRFNNEGLSLWYGTADAPAPAEGERVSRTRASLVVGVRPANPINRVVVSYRVNGGLVTTVPGREVRVDYGTDAQYFAVPFPRLRDGDVIEYSPTLSCAGRQVPAPSIADRFLSKFTLSDENPDGDLPAARSGERRSQPSATPHPGQRFETSLDFVGTLRVRFHEFCFVGETAGGMRVDFVVRDGVLEGHEFTAKLVDGSSDNMLIRPDGIGIIDFRGALVTDDGEMLDVKAGGYVDFGVDGYRRAVMGNLPDRSPLVVTPLISTRHSKYKWLSRVQCLGTGHTHLDAREATYDMFVAAPVPLV
jgi:hypothetical protein